MKKYVAILASLLFSIDSYSALNEGRVDSNSLYFVKMKQGTVSTYDDGRKAVKWSNIHPGTEWIFWPIGSGYFNIYSKNRTSACIYDSSGSIRAKMDSSCNKNYPRAEWKIVPADYTSSGYRYYIKNKLGRCLEVGYVSGTKKHLKAVDCDNGISQRFYLQ